MKRRSKIVRKGGQTRRLKTSKPKRTSTASKAASGRSLSAGEHPEVARLTRELEEAREQQAATSDVLRVISSGSSDLQTVFEAMLEKAVRVCDVMGGGICRWDGKALHQVAARWVQPAFAELMRHTPIYPNPKTNVGRMLVTKKLVHVPDLAAQPAYAEQREPGIVALVEIGRARTGLYVHMLRDNELVGAILLARGEVSPFTNKQIELVKNFATQAVIAIENARLLNELRQRTADLTERSTDLTEALEQQTATSEVLRVISSSPGDLKPVFETILASAARICDAHIGGVYRWDGEFAQLVATTPELPPAYAAVVRYSPFRPDPKSLIGRSVVRTTAVQFADFSADELYTNERDPFVVANVELARLRTGLFVPMLKGGEPIGFLTLARQDVRPFTDKQVALVENFAAQAVIAIENMRLLNELRQSLEQQTATGEVLGVISSSKFELQPILQSVVDTAARLCRADAAVIFRLEDGLYRFAAGYSLDPAYLDIERRTPIEPGPGTLVGRAAMNRQVARIDDAWADPLYETKQQAKLGRGFRSMMGVPLMRDGEAIGVIGLARTRVEPFVDREVDLVTTFADQAVIAIQNVRLFEAEQQRTRELARSLEDLRTAQDRLVQTEKLASLGQLTAGIAHEIKNPLNFVNNFSAVSVELIDELREALGGAQLNSKLRAEISEITETLQGNLDKVVQHGKRADAIVRNMLLHSRQGSGEHRAIDINALVEESLNLAYHGARAERQGFNIILEQSFDPAAGDVDVFPQEITRVLLNLISNGFYAANKRKAETSSGEYAPVLAVATKSFGDKVEIRIRDNGTGISPEVKEKLFNPFFTTKPAGEGTGLGLSISHDIVVKQHGGSIEVDTKPGEFTEVRIVLPRAGAFTAGRA